MGRSYLLFVLVFVTVIGLFDYFRLIHPKKKESNYLRIWSGRDCSWALNIINPLLPEKHRIFGEEKEVYASLYKECIDKAKDNYFGSKESHLKNQYLKNERTWMMAELYNFCEKKMADYSSKDIRTTLGKVMYGSMRYLEDEKVAHYAGSYTSNRIIEELERELEK